MIIIKKLAYKNIIISIVFRILCLVVAIPSIRILISTLGSEANGLNSLFISITSILSISELGIATSITFCMYKPIIDNDYKTVNALYKLFNKLYLIIGIIYICIGLIISPFIHLFATGNSYSNIQVLFLLYLIPSAFSFLYQSKIALLNAHKNNYITTIITQSSLLIKFSLQILMLYYFNSFELFYISYFISEIICFIVTNIVVKKKYYYLLNGNNVIDSKMKSELITRIKALFCHKIGGLFVNTTDNIIISTFISVVILGKYSNYILIMTSITSILVLLLTPLTSIIGHLYVKSKEETYIHYKSLYILNYIVSFIILSGYFAIADDVVVILFGLDQKLATSISIVIAITHFISMMRKPTLMLRDATGLYTHDKIKPLIECSFNFILSLILVRYFGVVGVLLSTIITSLTICHVIEPFIVFKYGFSKSISNFLIRNYIFVATFIINIFIIFSLKIEHNNPIIGVVINGLISVCSSSIILFIVFIIDKESRNNIKNYLNVFRNRGNEYREKI